MIDMENAAVNHDLSIILMTMVIKHFFLGGGVVQTDLNNDVERHLGYCIFTIFGSHFPDYNRL